MVDGVLNLFDELNASPNQRTYDIRLGIKFTLRKFNDVKKILEEMETIGMSSPKAHEIRIKTAIKCGNLEDAIQAFHGITNASSHLVGMLVDLACKEHQLPRVLADVKGVSITTEVIYTMLHEAVYIKDFGLVKRVQDLAASEKIEFDDACYALLIRGQGNELKEVERVFDAIIEKKVEFTNDICLSVLHACSICEDISLADRMVEMRKPNSLPVLTQLVRLYTELGAYEKACDFFENDLLPMIADKDERRLSSIDPRLEKAIIHAALKANRPEIAKRLYNSCFNAALPERCNSKQSTCLPLSPRSSFSDNMCLPKKCIPFLNTEFNHVFIVIFEVGSIPHRFIQAY